MPYTFPSSRSCQATTNAPPASAATSGNDFEEVVPWSTLNSPPPGAPAAARREIAPARLPRRLVALSEHGVAAPALRKAAPDRDEVAVRGRGQGRVRLV